MKILVLGSGVIGVTTAWYLREAGHAVTVVDRQPAPAMETSFGNGGQVSWGSAVPWAAPHIPWLALQWMFKPHSPLVLRPRLDPAMWRWLLAMLRNCTAARFVRNRERMLRLSRFSHDALVELRHQTGIQYDQSAHGTLVLCRTPQQLEDAEDETRLLTRLAIPFQVLNRAQCVAQEPALAPVAEKITGGIFYPGDESGDCRKFTEQLARRAEQNSVRFMHSTAIRHFVANGDRIESVLTTGGMLEADAYVVACGSYTPLLLRPLGLRLAVYPVKGYSLTFPVRDDAAAPRGTLTDETHKIVVTRLGNRLRVAGTAELAGYDLSLRPSRFAALTHIVRDLFPDAADLSAPEQWCGLRPMTPGNPPLIGPTRYANLYVNTGHGTQGWTMACGSGRVLAEVISGKEPSIPVADYAPL
jgi:D-amino-acid dehydrogenase